jgi:hypothetical protein
LAKISSVLSIFLLIGNALKYRLATILAKMMPELGPSIPVCVNGKQSFYSKFVREVELFIFHNKVFFQENSGKASF